MCVAIGMSSSILMWVSYSSVTWTRTPYAAFRDYCAGLHDMRRRMAFIIIILKYAIGFTRAVGVDAPYLGIPK